MGEGLRSGLSALFNLSTALKDAAQRRLRTTGLKASQDSCSSQSGSKDKALYSIPGSQPLPSRVKPFLAYGGVGVELGAEDTDDKAAGPLPS